MNKDIAVARMAEAGGLISAAMRKLNDLLMEAGGSLQHHDAMDRLKEAERACRVAYEALDGDPAAYEEEREAILRRHRKPQGKFHG